MRLKTKIKTYAMLKFIKVLFGFGSVNDGSICEFYKKTGIDLHDYPIDKGGDGSPFHSYVQKCHKCGKLFTI